MVLHNLPGPLEAINTIKILVAQKYGWNHVLNTLPVTIVVFVFVLSFIWFLFTILSMKKIISIITLVGIYICGLFYIDAYIDYDFIMLLFMICSISIGGICAIFETFDKIAYLEDASSKEINLSGQSGIGRSLVSFVESSTSSLSKCIYLDYNGSTPIFPEVTEAMLPYIADHYGNPSSGHAHGVYCKKALNHARQQVATMLDCSSDEIYFMSCGSEIDNYALYGSYRARKDRIKNMKKLPHIISTKIEHYAITKCLEQMVKDQLITFTMVNVDSDGIVIIDEIKNAITENTILITCMTANNEVGSIQPVNEISKLCHAKNILFFTDAAQAIGKINVQVSEIQPDMLAIVGHKFGAPKGIGAIYIRKGLEKEMGSFIYGAPQEGGIRAGSENVMQIVGLGKACEIVTDELDEIAYHMKKMTTQLYDLLELELGTTNVQINGPYHFEHRLPNTLSIGFKNCSSPKLIHELSTKVALSAGSACAKGISLTSTLAAMGCSEEFGLGTLRITCGRHTTVRDIQIASQAIIKVVKNQMNI